MTKFGKHFERSFKSLGIEAIDIALKDASLAGSDLNAVYVGNVGAGVISGQTCVPGQVILREMGIGGIPVINVENACASSATAFQQACSMVTFGAYDIVLACGVEKLFSEDKQKTFDVFSGGIDIEKTDEILASVGEKLRALGMDVDDGASAVIVVSEKKAKELGMDRMVKVEASSLSSGYDYEEGSSNQPPRVGANAIYEMTGIGPDDLDCVELHDASAISEIMYYEYLGLCNEGEGGPFVEAGHTKLGGKIPVNTSGGLMRKGHPIGATGTSQLTELVWQLRGEAKSRQVENARIALAENGGGYIGSDVAALALTILSKT